MKIIRNKKKFLYKILIVMMSMFIISNINISAQTKDDLKNEILSTIKRSTEFLADNVANNGGYVSHYLPDLSRQWGEMEAYPTMIWVQDPGTVSMGNTFLDEYETTRDEYFFKQAEKAARALIWGQLACGGWNYLIDFGGEKSLKKWYATYGKNAWRLEEFQHYYGNATFDDITSNGAALFLLRIYLTKMDPAFKAPLDKAIDFILNSQYPEGGWPQRFPLKHDFNKNGLPDYTSFYTFNDNVTWENVRFLITCYATLGENRFLEPIRRGMYFYLLTQGAPPQAAWGQQYTLDLKLAGARSYEIASFDPVYTARHIELLIKFYKLTGDKRFTAHIQDAFDWLNSIDKRQYENQKGFYIVPKFIEPGANKALYLHREGSNVAYGHYYFNYDGSNTVIHYRSSRLINLGLIENEFNKIKNVSTDEAVSQSPLNPGEVFAKSPLERFHQVMKFCSIKSIEEENILRSDKEVVENIIKSLDAKGRWLVKHKYTSNPYIGVPKEGDASTKKYESTFVGDKYDTSPYPDRSGQEYISINDYQNNVKILLKYLKDNYALISD